MNSDRINEILNFLYGKCLNYILVLILVIVGLSFLWKNYIYPTCTDWNSGRSAITENENKLASLQQEKKAKEQEKKLHTVVIKDVDVEIYKPKYRGLSIEASAIDFVTNLITMLEKTDNEILDLAYNSDLAATATEPIPSGVRTIRFYIEMNSSYTSYYRLLNELFSLPYLVSVKTVSLEPLKENKNILHVDMVVYLYVK